MQISFQTDEGESDSGGGQKRKSDEVDDDGDMPGTSNSGQPAGIMKKGKF